MSNHLLFAVPPPTAPIFKASVAFHLLAICCHLSSRVPCSWIASASRWAWWFGKKEIGEVRLWGRTERRRCALWKEWMLMRKQARGWCSRKASVSCVRVHSCTMVHFPDAVHFASRQSCCTLYANRTFWKENQLRCLATVWDFTLDCTRTKETSSSWQERMGILKSLCLTILTWKTSNNTNKSSALTYWIISLIWPVMGGSVSWININSDSDVGVYRLTKNGDFTKTHEETAHSSWACEITCFPQCHFLVMSVIACGRLTALEHSVSSKAMAAQGNRFVPKRLTGSRHTVPGKDSQLYLDGDAWRMDLPAAWRLALSCLLYPSKFCKNWFLGRKLVTKGPAFLKCPFLSTQNPPDMIWCKASCSANWLAMSWLSARWFDRMEQKWKIALNALYFSVATPNRGPKRTISSHRCMRRWYLIVCTILLGSISAAISSTLAAAVSTSD